MATSYIFLTESCVIKKKKKNAVGNYNVESGVNESTLEDDFE